MTGNTLMIQGTSSSAGKSLLTAALCRLFARRGLRVAPFKAQNMSNNAAVCADGAEIGRSQALQALAAGVAPEAAMNPVLLKPEADSHSQVIVNGRPWKRLGASDYFSVRNQLWPVVTAALDQLRQDYDLVVIEGAGSPAELNLSRREIVNMAVARYADSPVLLVGDIDRGGIFAQLLGTLWLLEPQERALVRGLVVNKFRGDRRLFDDGVRILEQRGDIPVLGVIPWIHNLDLPEEDAQSSLHAPRGASTWFHDLGQTEDNSFALKNVDQVTAGVRRRTPAVALTSDRPPGELEIVVIRLPRISNFDDFNPLAAQPGVRLRYADSLQALGHPDVVILPGTKSTMADLRWLCRQGLDDVIRRLAQAGTHVVGICGGYQMLSRRLVDARAVESSAGEMPGLNLLPIETTFAAEKITRQVRTVISDDRHCPGCRGDVLQGYEIHMGRSRGAQHWLRLHAGSTDDPTVTDGAVSDCGRVWGCYLHGLFDNDRFRQCWLDQARTTAPRISGIAPQVASCDASTSSWRSRVEASLDRLADAVEAALDIESLQRVAGVNAAKM